MANIPATPRGFQVTVSGKTGPGRPAKHDAILCGAQRVFSRDGYTRASIDAIAAEAEVSTRTIYNHFDDKAALFHKVVLYSTTLVAEAQIEVIHRHLDDVTDLEADLIAFGIGLGLPRSEHKQHFALIRHIDADIEHIPKAVIGAWRKAGPGRVIAELAERLRQLADQGLLVVDDPQTSAGHLMRLVSGAVPFQHGLAATRKFELEQTVKAGIHTFLYGHYPRASS